jgi:hypothetical protein
MKKLKVFKLAINSDNDTTGVDCVSLVNDPAIMKGFIAFSADGNVAQRVKFAVTDKAKQIVTGPIMIPDILIYRNQRDNTGVIIDEWYVTADKEAIQNVIQKFFRTQRSANTSAEHSGTLLNGVYLIESFQVDSSRGILPPIGYGNIPEGTWFGSYKIDQPEIWASVEDHTFNGFSIEGLFNYIETPLTVSKPSDVKMWKELNNILTGI